MTADYTIVYQALIAGVVTLILAWMQHRASVKVEEVRVALEDEQATSTKKLDAIAKTGDTVHALVNSAMGIQLKISSVALRKIAAITKDPADVREAETAEKMLHEHEAKQVKADAVAAKTSPDITLGRG